MKASLHSSMTRLPRASTEARADVLKSLSRTLMLEVGDGDEAARGRVGEIELAFDALEREARSALKREGFDDSRQTLARTIAARYRGLSFELEIAWNGGRRLVERFHAEHESRYGYAQTADSIEVVSARLLHRVPARTRAA